MHIATPYDKLLSKMKILFILIFIQLIFINPIFALELNTRDEYLLDVRDDDGDIYRSHIAIDKKIESPELEISAFVDAQWNLETDKWEKVMLGAGVSKSLWQYLYIGQTLQLISGEMLDYMSFEVDNKSFDTTTKIGVRVPFWDYFSLNASEEYSINLEELRDEYCESVAEVTYTPKKWITISLGWRHTDRIHNFDTDYATIGILFHF